MDNTTQATTNYGIFNLMADNREPNRGHVEILKQAFSDTGNLTRVQPIIVNDHYQIIDGQHRFIACKELGLPVHFTMIAGLGINEARSMNILQRNWESGDYAHSYAQTDPDYQQYLDWKEETGYNHSTLMGLVYGSNRNGMYAAFRRGEFEIEDKDEAIRRFNEYEELKEAGRIERNPRELVGAYLRISKSPEYNQAQMVRKLKISGEFKLAANGEEVLRDLENVFNRGRQEVNRVRLF